MMTLAFERRAQMLHGRRVRAARFESRSALAVSAACLVANGVREALSAALGAPAVLRLLEPVIPDREAWTAIAAGAQLYRMPGSLADAVFVLRPADAAALAAAAFGEPAGEARGLSPVESQVLLRVVRAMCGCLAPVCGGEPAPLERILDISGYVTYFELLLERPVAARIGIALSREPVARSAATLRIEDLLDVEIELSVQFAAGEIPAAAFLDLREGVLVPMMTRVGERGRLCAGGTVLARGECGSLRERNALIVSAAP